MKISVSVETPPPVEKTVCISMGEKEAQVLRALLGAMSGTLFELYSKLNEALEKAGCERLYGNFTNKKPYSFNLNQ